jgi:lipoprotein-anchoring transpeptidase ErfK/SrfK
MEVVVDGVKKYSWQVSTGKEGWRTRPGSYTPFALTPFYYSKRWNTPLSYLISIGEDGTAIHGTTQTDRVGWPASHGCIRLNTKNAAILYHLVEAYGMWSTQIIVVRSEAVASSIETTGFRRPIR